MQFLSVSPMAIGVAVFFVVLFIGGVIMMIRRRKSASPLPPPPTVRVVMPNQYTANDAVSVGTEPVSASASAPPAPIAEEQEETLPPVPSARPRLAKLGFLLILLSVIAVPSGVFLVSRSRPQTTRPQAAMPNDTVVRVSEGLLQVDVFNVSDTFDPTTGAYTATFRFEVPAEARAREINLLVASERDICPEANGQTISQAQRYTFPFSADGGCFTPWLDDAYHMITLNSSNNYTQTLTVTSHQEGNLACGSFQIDIWFLSLNGLTDFLIADSRGVSMRASECPLKRLPGYQFEYQGTSYPNGCSSMIWGIHHTGRALAECQVPTLTPTVTVPVDEPTLTPTITPTATPNPNQCLNVKLYDADWTLVAPEDMTQFTAGDTIHIAVVGKNDLLVSKGRIRVKAGTVFSDWTETTETKPGDTNVNTKEFYIDYTFPPHVEHFAVEAEVFDNGVWR